MTAPLTRAEIAALPPVIGLRDLAGLMGEHEGATREKARNGALEALGVKVWKTGNGAAAQWRFSLDSALRALGMTQPHTESAPDPAPPSSGPAADAFAAEVLRSLGERLLAAAGAITESGARSAPGHGRPTGEGVRQPRRLRAAGGGDGTA